LLAFRGVLAESWWFWFVLVSGVQSVMVEAAQLKVTVTGTMDVATLVQRLHKSGKNGVHLLINQ